MAYAATITFDPPIHNGAAVVRGRTFFVQIAETEGAAASEAQIDFGAKAVLLRLLRADLTETSGTATTYHPRIGPVTAPTGYNGGVLIKASATAPPISEQGSIGSVMRTSDVGVLFYRSTPDAGSDNITTVKLWFEVL